MIEFLIVLSTIASPSCGSPPCYQRMEIEQFKEGATTYFNTFFVRTSSPITECEATGKHDWVWDNVIPHYKMFCSRCNVERKIKRVEHKREVTDIDEVWEDDGSKVERPQIKKEGFIFNPGDYIELPSTQLDMHTYNGEMKR